MESGVQGTHARSWADLPARPTCARDALTALTLVSDRLGREGDTRAAFADAYTIITRRVTERVALGPGRFFLEPGWISRLAGRFCERYLETLRWSLDGAAQDTGAWSAAYEACAAAGSPPTVNVLLGLSAHINADLATGIHRTIVELGAAGDDAMLARFRHDHDAVNELLDASIPEAFVLLIHRHACPIARGLFQHAYAVTRWATMQVLTAWRARVWDDALELVAADGPAARARVARRMERRSARYARLIKLSSPRATDRACARRSAVRCVRVLDALR